MNSNLFQRFSSVIASLTEAELSGSYSLYERLTLAEHDGLRVCYAPFEYVNPTARVVIVGITPGKTQMLNALREAKHQLQAGAPESVVLEKAKVTGAFSGPMRQNLTRLLDSIGVHSWLGIDSCTDLFGASAQLVQTASVLRNPVFIDGENYNGSPNMTRHPLLLEQLTTYFVEDVRALPNAIFIPLGDKVSEALHFLSAKGVLDGSKILDGLPHPSGANAERIAYFIGEKPREALSSKTNPEKLERARGILQQQILALG